MKNSCPSRDGYFLFPVTPYSQRSALPILHCLNRWIFGTFFRKIA